MTDTILEALLFTFTAALVLFLPGLGWHAWFRDPERDLPSSLADALALSISVTALAALALFLMHVRVNALMLVGIYATLAVAAAAGWLRQAPARRRWLLYTAGTLAILAVTVAWRLYQVRTLVLPAWVDSVHHVLIVRLFLENGGIPADFSPYLPVSFSYHYAFHALAALFSAVSGAEPARSVLVLGQVLNALVALQVYRLGRAVWPGVLRSLLAGLLVAFVFQMPAYYATWGRYTLLTGLLLLPSAAAAALELTRGTARRETVTRLAVLTAGTIISHYLAALLLAMFYMVLAVFWLAGKLHRVSSTLPPMEELLHRAPKPASPLPEEQLPPIQFSISTEPLPPGPVQSPQLSEPLTHLRDQSSLVPLVIAAGAGFLAALPWVLRVWQLNQASFNLQVNLAPDAPDQLYFNNYVNYLWYLAGPRRNYILMLVGIAGGLLALRSPAGRRLAAWWLGIILLTVPWGLRLGPFRPDHMAIVWFLPAALAAGHLLVSAAEAARRRLPSLPGLLLSAAAVFGLLLWGFVDTAKILNPATNLVSQADLPALAWIKENTSPGARFWINTAHWQGNTYRGVDGGWWITPLTGRSTLLPVVFYSNGPKEYFEQINAWALKASEVKDCSPDFYETAHQAGATYVYLREGAGSFQPEAADACPGLVPVYEQDGVSIYKISG